jgi:hypothetical protein
MDNLEKRLLLAYEGAIATRGKNKGMLKAKCPPMGTDSAVMWQACMYYANPYKVSLFSLVFHGMADDSFKDACFAFAAERASVLPNLDRDRVALTKLGAW